MRFVFPGVLLIALSASAQSLSAVVMDTQSITDANAKRVHRAAVTILEQLTGLPVLTEYERPRRSCAQMDLVCQKDRVKHAAVALWLSGGARDTVSVDAAFWIDGERSSNPKSATVQLDALEMGLKPLLTKVTPSWMKKGVGGIAVPDEPDLAAVLKIDGRIVADPPEVVPVTAGPHQVDVLLPDGRAVLQRVDVPEAGRARVDLTEAPAPTTKAAGFSTLRFVSYAAWMVGAATLLSSFIVGFVGRSTANGQSPCRPDSRECVTIEQAMEQQRKAAGYASTANVLLGTGLVFSLAGAGLFTFDVLR